MPVTISVEEQLDLLNSVFRGLGAGEEASGIQSEILTEADLIGLPSHGLQRLPVLVERIRHGLIRVDAEPVKEWKADAVLSVNGMDGLGPVVVEGGLRELAPVARKHGIASLAVRDCSHLGMLSYYCSRQADAGLICIGMTTSEALVHPYGGSEALIGTNPLAIGIPSAPRSFVFDMATSIVPMGKVLAYLARGEVLEAGWAVDAEGRPTTDPAAARWGSIAPVGGAKGYGLGVSIGILAGLLSGGEVGKTVRGTLDTEYRCNKGDLFILIDPMAFPGGPGLAEAAGRYLDELRSSRPQEGFERVAVPGDRSRAMREVRLKNGISHPEDIWYAAQRVRASI